MAQKGMVSKVGQVGFYLSLLGSVMFAWVQIEQTFVWPRIVEEAPNLEYYSFPLLGNNQFDFIYWPAHLLLAVGLFLFGQATARAGVFPRWAGHLLWFGGLTFGISGIVLGLRFLSIITLGPALIWMGFLQWRGPRGGLLATYVADRSVCRGEATEHQPFAAARFSTIVRYAMRD